MGMHPALSFEITFSINIHFSIWQCTILCIEQCHAINYELLIPLLNRHWGRRSFRSLCPPSISRICIPLQNNVCVYKLSLVYLRIDRKCCTANPFQPTQRNYPLMIHQRSHESCQTHKKKKEER